MSQMQARFDGVYSQRAGGQVICEILCFRTEHFYFREDIIKNKLQKRPLRNRVSH